MEATVRQLKTQLKNISTESLLGMISLNFISTSNYDGGVTNMLTTIMDIPLKAPQRQLIYLAGLLLTTDEAANPRHIDRAEFLQILTEIQNAFCGARRNQMRFRADILRSKTDAPKLVKI